MQVAGGGFRVTVMQHPVHFVSDLGEAERFFETVFGRQSIPVEEILKRVPYVRPDFPRDYSIYTLIADVFFDCLDRGRLVMDGDQAIRLSDESAEARHPVPHLGALSFAIEGQAEAYRALRNNGYTILNTLGEKQEGPVPVGPNDPAPFFTIPEEAGAHYHFYPATVFPCDPRTEPGWVLPPVSADDPLGIERSSHHTVLTDQPARATRMLVDVLGGESLGEGRNELLGSNSTYIRFGDSTLEFAVPDEGTAAHKDWAIEAPRDTYHSITWKTVDLERVERHLEACGVRIRGRSETAIITDPETSLGVPWGFAESLLNEDPRNP